MRKIKITILLQVTVLFLICGGNEIFAQCGADGTQPCPPKTSVKKSTASAKQAARETAAKQRLAREIAQREIADRQRIAREISKRKKSAAKNARAAVPEWIKNVAAYGKLWQAAKPLELFPVAEVTLGETGSKYLSLVGENCGIKDDDGKLTNCYNLKDISFYTDEEGVSNKLYITRLRFEGMPDEWRKLGFGWDLSYNDWFELFKQKGYPAFATEKPSVVARSGTPSKNLRSASEVKTSGKAFRLILNFNHGYGKTSLDDEGTLFSMEIEEL